MIKSGKGGSGKNKSNQLINSKSVHFSLDEIPVKLQEGSYSQRREEQILQ